MMTPTPLARALTLAITVTMLAATLPAHAPKPAEPGARDRCAVCGMLVAPYPEWTAQVAFADGTSAFFDGSKDLFKYLLDRDRYLPERRHVAILQVYVTSYYDVRHIPARQATFVTGSEVLGPMGPELVPVASMAEAEEFMRDHGGSRALRFDEITMDVIRNLE